MEYTRSTWSGRRQFIERSIEEVDYDELDVQIKAHGEVQNRKNRDPTISTWRFAAMYHPYKLEKILRTLGERSMVVQGRPVVLSSYEEEKNAKAIKGIMDYVPAFIPPKKRIRIMKNITFNKKDVIPVYSDVPDETIDSVVIPDSLLFDYTDVNFFNQLTEHNLARAVSMSHKTPNHIKCDCCSKPDGSAIPCYENPNCPCYLMNSKMQQFQKPSDGCPPVKFTSCDPIMFTVTEDHFYQHIGFACSELCGCKGNCTNNTLLIPNKRLFPIEVFRTNYECGFGIRSDALIPAGTPIMEFAGEIVGEQIHIPGANWNNNDYAYQITYSSDKMLELLLGKMEFTDNYKTLLQGLYEMDYYIDPKICGNIGRMAAHSCAANMELVRVFQKSLSPAHIHLVMVAVVDIFPGTPLTIDYGQEYAKRLRNKCQCGTFICMNGPEAKDLKTASHAKLTKCHNDLYMQQLKVWNRDVLKHYK